MCGLLDLPTISSKRADFERSGVAHVSRTAPILTACHRMESFGRGIVAHHLRRLLSDRSRRSQWRGESGGPSGKPRLRKVDDRGEQMGRLISTHGISRETVTEADHPARRGTPTPPRGDKPNGNRLRSHTGRRHTSGGSFSSLPATHSSAWAVCEEGYDERGGRVLCAQEFLIGDNGAFRRTSVRGG